MTLLNDAPSSSPSSRAEMAMSWVCHFNVVTPRDNANISGNFHRKGYLMLHHLAGATIQVASLVN